MPIMESCTFVKDSVIMIPVKYLDNSLEYWDNLRSLYQRSKRRGSGRQSPDCVGCY